MPARDFCRRLCLMNWKNLKLQVGSPLQLVFILLCPSAFAFIAVFLRFNTPMRMRTDKIYDAIDLTRIWMEMVEDLQERRQLADSHNVTRNPYAPHLVIGWAPGSYNIFQEVMNQAHELFQPMTLRQFKDCDELRDKIVDDSLFAGICFDGTNHEDFPKIDENYVPDVNSRKVLNYSIIFPAELRQNKGNFRQSNWLTLYTDDPQALILHRINLPYEGGFVGYVREGFILIQKAVTESYLKLISQKDLPEIKLRRFPVLAYKEDELVFEIDTGMAMIILFGYLFPAQLFIWQIVREKQSQLRLFLINMNIGNLIQFVSWFITCMVCTTLSTMLVVILLKMPWNLEDAVLSQTPWYILLVVLLTYNAAAISFLCMVASFFTNALNAVRVLTILWVATYLPNLVLWNNLEKDVRAIRYIAYFLSNVVMGMVFEGIVDRESIKHTGWENYNYDLTYRPRPISVITSTWTFLISALICCAVGIYMEIWRLGDRSARRADRDEGKASNAPDDPFRDWTESVNQQVRSTDVNSTKIYEVEPSNRRFKLKIKKLCKRFGPKDRPALNLFTWNVYENEVTVLMGHNGCGKTTLLKILAGLMEPSQGSVTVSNYNIQTERKAACMELGVALGNQLLLTSLTVYDQLRFMCQVKGIHNITDVGENIHYFMQALKIDHLKHKRLDKLKASELTLVNICCAFVGNSRIVLIDDIYSDLDKQTKALIWALFNEEKSHRTIIVVVNTTLLAEAIADRLAIMSNGELKCTGTKPFLKNMYGHGFRLICVKGKNVNMPELLALVSKYMPTLSVETNLGFKVNFVLENKDEDQFPMLIDELEENMERLDVLSFRMRDTSMEEIFLRFGCDKDDQMGGVLGWNGNPNLFIEEYFETLAAVNKNKQRSGCRLWLLHLRAVFFKRWTAGFRHWIVVILELLTFLIAALCTFSGAFIHGKGFVLVPLTYNLSQLDDVRAFVELFSEEEEVKDMLAYYSELLYWYDAEVTVLGKRHDDKYALQHPSDFSRTVNLQYMLGATFDKAIVTAWFNTIPLHIAPYALNVVHNAVARHLFDEEANIDVTLETLPFQTSINLMPPRNQYFGDSLAMSGGLLLSLIFPAISLFLIRERASCMKKQQLLAGARFSGFWAFTALYDVLYMVAYALCVCLFVAGYHHPDHNAVLYEKEDYTAPLVRDEFIVLVTWHIVLGLLLFLVEFRRIVGFAAFRAAPKETVQSDDDLRLSSTQITSQMSEDPFVNIQRQGPSDLTPEERSQQAVVAVRLFTQRGKVQVLKNLNFTLAKGECLNIAGSNNSGKSTLLKLIVYETKLTSGQIWIHGYPVHSNRMRCYRMVGYCPQYDNLPAEFTPRQLLYIQALFHGHGKRDAWNVTEALLRMLGLLQCCDRSVQVCTSGEERRIYYAFAVLSSPQLVCVDGVPAGLDPIAKRIILTVTTIMQSMGSSFLYTSLNNLDVERLCVRTPVLFEGEVWMIGSIEEGNNNYKTGYQLEVRFKRKVNPNVSMSRATWNRINHLPLSPHKKFTAFMEIKFPSAVLRREDETTMVFDMELEATTFATIFLTLRKDSFEMNIEDYFITRNMRISHSAEK